MTDPSQVLAGLSLAEKRMLLAQLLREKGNQSLYPLAHGQRGLWLLDQLERGNAAYNICFPSRIRSPLDHSAFRRALQGLIDRHPCLRTTFEECNGTVLQRVHENATVSLEVIDASLWSDEVLRATLQDKARRPFDLERGPLVHTYLFTRSPEDHVFLMTAHHIVGDFWSLVLVMEDMQALYPAERNGRGPGLSPLTTHYRDFVRWQSEMLAGPASERLWSYWKQQLAGVPPVLELPTDRIRPPRFTYRGSAVPCRLGPDLTRRLKSLADSQQVTLYTVLLAAFQVLLGRCSGQDKFLIGSPFAGRTRPEFEQVVGCFINLLPLRANLSGDPTFRTYLLHVGSTVLNALQHQDYPFSLLVERLNAKRDPSRHPLVQVSFTLEKAQRTAETGAAHFFLPHAEGRLTVGGLHHEPYPLERQTCQMDLEMVLEEGNGTIEGMVCWCIDLFSPAGIQRMVGRFQTLLESIAADPDARLSELAWLKEAERRQVVSGWNKTRADHPKDLYLHQLFEKQAARTPEAVALSFGSRMLRYAELDSWANRVACGLRELGVGPNTPVALCLERSPEMVAGMLAALKAGGAYVPLDPSSPAERLRSFMADLRAPVLLTQPHLLSRLPVLDAKVICLHSSSEEAAFSLAEASPAARHTACFPIARTPTDLAYIIYTSGSTGRPKGVMVEHSAICNTIQWRLRTLPLREDDRVLLSLPYFSDSSVCTIFSTLAAGARLVLAEPGEDRDPSRLRDRIAEDEITILQLIPSLLHILVDGPKPSVMDSCRTLRWICCGGEAMPPDLPSRLFKLLTVALYNLYGPTEVAVEAAWWDCRGTDARTKIPIGRPITNVQVYVLDQARQPVPVGVPGELYIGGAGLSRGYLNDPGLTARRFLPDPFSGQPGGRLFRTGDRCRWLSDGSLELLGRVDQQVKVRGYRIELAEIEVALASKASVFEAVLGVHTNDAGMQRLVAYVVAHSDAEPPTADQLRRHLKGILPEYMVPSHFVVLPELPRLPNGKLNRLLLPAPLNGQPRTELSHVAPRTPLEEFLAEHWRDLLRVDAIGVEDNFFDQGGSSLQMAVLINRVQNKLAEPVSTIGFFESPTIAAMARCLSQACPETIRRVFGPSSLRDKLKQQDGSFSSLNFGAHGSEFPLLVPLQPEGSRHPCFMVHPPGGIVVCYRALAHHMGREQPFYGIRSRGLQGEQNLPTRLEDMAAEYVAAIRKVQPEGPYHLGGWSIGGVAAFEMAQQLRAQGQSVGLLAMLDTTIPSGPANRNLVEEADQSGREYGLDLTLEELRQLGPDEQLPYLWQHAQKLGLVEVNAPPQLVQQILQDLKRLFHLHVQLATDYVLRPYPGRLTLFRPSESPFTVPTTQDRGWIKLAAAVDVHFVPGQHHTMVKKPHVQVLAQQLRTCLLHAEKFTPGSF
jgi:amino acid adenylation domain-containing protein